MESPKGKDLYTLLKIKNGFNNLNMSYLLPFFEKIKQKFSPKLNFINGNTGLAFRYYLPSTKIKNYDDLKLK